MSDLATGEGVVGGEAGAFNSDPAWHEQVGAESTGAGYEFENEPAFYEADDLDYAEELRPSGGPSVAC